MEKGGIGEHRGVAPGWSTLWIHPPPNEKTISTPHPTYTDAFREQILALYRSGRTPSTKKGVDSAT
jgi:hypothetical protein